MFEQMNIGDALRGSRSPEQPGGCRRLPVWTSAGRASTRPGGQSFGPALVNISSLNTASGHPGCGPDRPDGRERRRPFARHGRQRRGFLRGPALDLRGVQSGPMVRTQRQFRRRRPTPTGRREQLLTPRGQ